MGLSSSSKAFTCDVTYSNHQETKMKTTFFLVKKAISCLVAKPWRRANFQSLAITIVQVSVHLKNHKSVICYILCFNSYRLHKGYNGFSNWGRVTWDIFLKKNSLLFSIFCNRNLFLTGQKIAQMIHWKKIMIIKLAALFRRICMHIRKNIIDFFVHYSKNRFWLLLRWQPMRRHNYLAFLAQLSNTRPWKSK